MKQIVIFISEQCLASSVTGPMDLFNVTNNVWNYMQGKPSQKLFNVTLAAETLSPVRTSSGIMLQPDKTISEITHCDFLMIAAYHYDSEKNLVRFIEKQKASYPEFIRLHQNGAMVGGYCSATFVLAESGLLDSKPATTSWWLKDFFCQRYAKISMTMDKLVVEQSGIWTAGATTSYLSLCLKIIEKLVDQQVASLVSKVMLVDNNRPSQLPFIEIPNVINHTDSVIAKCQNWLQENLAKSISLEDMAAKSAMSKRHFIRRFKKAVGEPPASYLQRLRINAAKRYLETTDLKLEQIIEKVGYEDSSAFRRIFQKLTSLTPKAYRVKFSMIG